MSRAWRWPNYNHTTQNQPYRPPDSKPGAHHCRYTSYGQELWDEEEPLPLSSTIGSTPLAAESVVGLSKDDILSIVNDILFSLCYDGKAMNELDQKSPIVATGYLHDVPPCRVFKNINAKWYNCYCKDSIHSVNNNNTTNNWSTWRNDSFRRCQ